MDVFCIGVCVNINVNICTHTIIHMYMHYQYCFYPGYDEGCPKGVVVN